MRSTMTMRSTSDRLAVMRRERIRSDARFERYKEGRLMPDERAIVRLVERSNGRPLTPQEIYLSLEQARALGVI
jgi:hypothetical protein